MQHDDPVARAAQPLLESEEVIEVATIARVGRVVPSLMGAIAVTVGTLGFASSAVEARTPVVLTSSRLLVLATKGWMKTPVSRLTHAFSRADLRARQPLTVLGWTSVDVTDARGRLLARLRFKLQARKAALQLVEALGPAPDAD